ncbi:MAG TPA: hypothetical protein VKB93_20385 [Thermoanaerobaculia bacterium]|nr:hypothetical protein [Thermoanaerobaculia bacterium]
MATLSEQLAQAASALSIAGVPATAQPGQIVTASLTPPLTAVQFTDLVPTDVSLDLLAKDVVFTNTNINDPNFAADPALTKIKPLFNFVTLPPSLDNSGTGGLIGKIQGTLALPIAISAIPQVTVQWEILDQSDNVLVAGNDFLAPSGLNNPTLDVIFLPAFSTFDGTFPPPAIRKIRARVTLTAGTETGTAVIGPVIVAIPTLPFPKVLVLSLHTDHRGAALVMVPGNSAITTVNHLKSLLQPVRNAISTLTTIARFAEMITGIDGIVGALESTNIAFSKADSVSNLNNIDLITRPWYEFNDTEAEDELSSFVYLSAPPQIEGASNAVEMFNRRDFRSAGGKFTVTTGDSLVALCRTLNTGAPTVTPAGATLTVNTPPPPLPPPFNIPGTFGDTLSSIRFL